MAEFVHKKVAATITVKSSVLLLVFAMSAPSRVFSGRIPQIPAGHRAQYLLLRPDGGYSSGYDTGLGQTATEEGDSRNEVHGEYAGGPLRVQYTAGVAGYVPTVQVETPPASLFASPQPPHFPLPHLTPSTWQPTPPPQALFLQRASPIDAANTQVAQNTNSFYAFAYQTPDQSRQEYADAQNNVRGSFSFVAPDDGVNRRVDYNAGAGIGFVAQGAHLPTVAQTSVTIPQTAVTVTTPQTIGGGTVNAQAPWKTDGSYAFAYQTSDQSRQESADAQNNVQGSFSFVAPDDGVRRKVNYQAGSQTGFVAQGDHLPSAPQGGVTEETQATTEPGSTASDDITTPSNEESGGGNSDASYAFAYQTPDQERAESADRAGNVRGYYSFVAPDGVRRRVDIEAGAGKGVIVHGDHLPTSPPVPTGVNLPQNNQFPGAAPLTPVSAAYAGRNTGTWSTTVPDPLRVDTNLGNLVVRTYLPSHPVKAGYVLDIE